MTELDLDGLSEDTRAAAAVVLAERARQTDVEGFDAAHDDSHVGGGLALAAVCYAVPDGIRVRGGNSARTRIVGELWPWRARWWKPSPDKRIRELAKAGALIMAEIERLQRVEAAGPWVCPQCEHQNGPDDEECYFCDSRRP